MQRLEPRHALSGTGFATAAAAARADTTPPTVASLSAPAAVSHGLGAVLAFKVSFSEKVTVTGSPTLPIEIGGSVRNAAWNGQGSGSKSLTFATTVLAADVDTDGLRVVGPIGIAPGAAIKDLAGNSANPAIPAKFQIFPKVTVDAVPPALVSFDPPVISGTSASVRVAFSEAVVVSGKPLIPFTVGGVARQLVYAAGSGSAALTFRYKAAKGESLAPTNVSVPQESPIVLPGKASIADRARNAATLTRSPPPSPAPALTAFLGTTFRHVLLDQPRPLADGDPAGTVVGTLVTIDYSPGNAFTYALVAGAGADDNPAFSIVGSQLVAARNVDFESQADYAVRVRSTDRAGAVVELALMIVVADVNERPTSVGLSTTAVVTNQPAGSIVGVLTTTDADAGDSFTYALVAGPGGDDNGSFTVVGNQLHTTRTLVRESQAVHRVRVRSVDSGNLATERALEITVIGDTIQTGGRALTSELDPRGVNPWSSVVTLRSPSGTILRKVVTYDAGHVTHFHFDPDNAHGWRTITESYAASGALDWSWTHADDGTSVYFDADQAQANDWATIVDVFDAAGNFDKEVIRYDAGTRTLLEIDQDGRSPLASSSQSFDAAGRLERTLWTLDDGSSCSATHDPTDTRDQRRAVEAYDPQGRFDHKWIVNRGGDAAFIDDDQAEAVAWSTLLVMFDASGRHVSVQRTAADGAYARFDLDNDSTKAWWYRIYGFTPDGQLASAFQVDDGGATHSQTFDTSPAPGRRDVLDQAGRLDYTVEVFADGSRRVVDHDQAGTEPWTRVTYHRLPGGTLDAQSVIMDDGSRRDTDFDQAQAHAWRSREDLFDAAGSLDARWTSFDDGTKTYWDVDQSGRQEFDEYTDFYDSLGRLLLETKLYRDGRRTAYEIDVTKARAWVTRYTTYDAAGNVDSVKETKRDQTATYTKHDPANLDPSVRQFTDRYNAAGVATARDTAYDNGSRALIEHDVDNAFEWAYRIDAWDPAGNVDYVHTRLDDGSTRNVDYDSLNENPREKIRTWWYDAAGRATYTHVLYDDGTEYSEFL